eukprot:PITA_28048
MFASKQKLAALPLVPSIISACFLQWGLDFVGEIHPTSSNQHRWILTATDYFTKWVEAILDSTDEPDDFSRRINQIIELNENRHEVQYKLKKYQHKMKTLFDRRGRERDFREGDLVLRWDSTREENGKHGKFDNPWFGPLAVAEEKGNNTFLLQKS